MTSNTDTYLVCVTIHDCTLHNFIEKVVNPKNYDKDPNKSLSTYKSRSKNVKRVCKNTTCSCYLVINCLKSRLNTLTMISII